MSRQPQMLQGEVSFKRQVISIVIITGIVFAAWWSLTGIMDMVSGGSRSGYDAQQDLSDSPGGTYGLFPIEMPSVPDIDWDSLLENLSPEQLQQMAELLSGNLDNLDPSLLAGLLGADPEALNTVMFRVFDYPSVSDVQSELFRYSVFDSFSNSEWAKSSSASVPGSYETNYITPDVTPQYRIRLPQGTITAGEEYSITVPGVSPETYIQQGSVHSQYNNFDWGSVQTPYVDDFGVMSLEPVFTASGSQNISVRSWGFERSGGSYYYNSTTRANPAIIPVDIQAQYLEFPGGVTASQYAASRPYFTAVAEDIQDRFDTNPSANLFVKANMIRNYIQDSFSCDPVNPSEAADIVEETCQTLIGDYTAISSTYIMLARYFQIPARFVMGYSGQYASETMDPTGSWDYVMAQSTVEIKLLNIYVWAETFMPVEDDGTGDWVPMDVLQTSFSDGYSDGNPEGSPIPPNTELRVFLNGTTFDPSTSMYLYSVDRPTIVNITVNVTVVGTPYNGSVTLYDLLEDQTLSIITATNGWGTFLWNVSTNVIAGGHAIRVSAGALMNFTGVGVRGILNLAFEERVPDTIYRPSPNQDLRVIGYLEDIAYTGNRSNNNVPKANISVDLSMLPDPFTPGTIKTNDTGEFATNITLNPSVVDGSYNVRLYFYGMFTFTIPQVGQVSVFVDSMSATSVMRTLEVLDPNGVVFNFYVAGNDRTHYTTRVNPGATVNLTANIIIGGTPQTETWVYFYYQGANATSSSYIMQAITNSTGWANYTWTVPTTIGTGPAVIEAYFYDTINSEYCYDAVYCVVNRSINLGYISTPSPTNLVVDDDWFSFSALLNDNTGNAVPDAIIHSVILDTFGSESGFSLRYNPYTFTSASGYAGFGDQVTGSGIFTTYYVDVWFNNTFYFHNSLFYNIHHYDPGWVTVPWFDSDNAWQCPIVISDGSYHALLLWINGTETRLDSYTDANPPRSYTKGQIVELMVRAISSGGPQDSESISFYDVSDGNTLLGTITTAGGGWATCNYLINPNTFTGPHQLRVIWASEGLQNYTVAFVNSSTVTLDSFYVSPSNVIRGQTAISVSGYLHDGNTRGIYRGQVNLVLLSSTGNYIGSGYFTGGSTNQITSTSGAFAFNVMISTALQQGTYQIRVDFNQTIDATSFSACPTYLTSASGFLASKSSGVTTINVNASVRFSQAIYSPATPEAGEYITVSGYILWDNGSTLDSGTYQDWINVTVWETSNSSHILAMANLIDGTMNPSGYISISIQVIWIETFSVRWEFISEDILIASTNQVATGAG